MHIQEQYQDKAKKRCFWWNDYNQQVSIAATTLNAVQINVGPGGGAGTGAEVSVDSIGIGGTLSFISVLLELIVNPGCLFLIHHIQISLLLVFIEKVLVTQQLLVLDY